MVAAAQALLETVTTLKESLLPDQQTPTRDILVQLNRYLRLVAASDGAHKKESDLADPLDAAFKVAILLFENIDTGSTGADDAVAEQLKAQYRSYFGTLRL